MWTRERALDRDRKSVRPCHCNGCTNARKCCCLCFWCTRAFSLVCVCCMLLDCSCCALLLSSCETTPAGASSARCDNTRTHDGISFSERDDDHPFPDRTSEHSEKRDQRWRNRSDWAKEHRCDKGVVAQVLENKFVGERNVGRCQGHQLAPIHSLAASECTATSCTPGHVAPLMTGKNPSWSHDVCPQECSRIRPERMDTLGANQSQRKIHEPEAEAICASKRCPQAPSPCGG